LKNKKCFIYSNGKQTRDFVFVNDVATANLIAIEKQPQDIFNISTNRKTTILELYKLLNKKTEGNLKFTKPRKGDIRKSVLDNNKAKKTLGWQPEYGLEEGIKQTISYFKNNP